LGCPLNVGKIISRLLADAYMESVTMSEFDLNPAIQSLGECLNLALVCTRKSDHNTTFAYFMRTATYLLGIVIQQ